MRPWSRSRRSQVKPENEQKLNEIKEILGLGSKQDGHPIWLDLWDVQCRGLINCLKDKDWHGSGKPFGYPIYEITTGGGDQDFPPIMAPVGWNTVKWPVGREDVYALRCYLHMLAENAVRRKASPNGLSALARVRDNAQTERTMEVSPKPKGKGTENMEPAEQPVAQQVKNKPGTSKDHETGIFELESDDDLPDAEPQEFLKRPKKDKDEYDAKDEFAANEMEDADNSAFLKMPGNEDQRFDAKPPEAIIPHQILHDPTENDEDDLDYMDEDQDSVLGEDDAAQYDNPEPDDTIGRDKYDTA